MIGREDICCYCLTDGVSVRFRAFPEASSVVREFRGTRRCAGHFGQFVSAGDLKARDKKSGTLRPSELSRKRVDVLQRRILTAPGLDIGG